LNNAQLLFFNFVRSYETIMILQIT